MELKIGEDRVSVGSRERPLKFVIKKALRDLLPYWLFGGSISPNIRYLCEPEGSGMSSVPRGGVADIHELSIAPKVMEDGLGTATLEEQGIDPTPIGKMLDAIEAGQFTKVDSILLSRGGQLILEAYFNGYSHEIKHDIRSAFKNITSTLAGIALDQRLIASKDTLISNYFSEYWPKIQNQAVQKNRITVEHLLTMSSGFDVEERYGIGPYRETDMFWSWDWIEFTLNLPMIREPGEQFAYNSSTSFLLGEIVARAAGQSLLEFAKTNLFEPLGITDYCWTLNCQGLAVAQGNFYVRPRDMIKIGELYLNQGVWKGERLVSEAWVQESTLHRYDLPASEEDSELDQNGYGYQWWTKRMANPLHSHYYASGDGGQKIFIFPHLDLVAVFTGSHYGQEIGHTQPVQILNNYVLPAIRN